MSAGRWRRPPGEMVQPGATAPGPGTGGGNAAEAGGGAAAGDEASAAAAAAVGGGGAGGGGGGGGGPAGPCSAEILQRLLLENRELKAALWRCSAGLRGRVEELRRVQGQRRAEREAVRGRAGQARALVERLREERDEAAHRLSCHLQQQRQPPEAPQDPDPSPSVPPAEDTPGAPPDPSSSLEQLQQRLAATEAELSVSRGALAAAEQRAQEASARAEQQLQELRRQLEQDKASVKAQVTSLLGELRESQSRLDSARRERDQLQHRARVAGERSRALAEASSGQSVQLDQLRLQVTNLETALSVERRAASEEKRKLVQLQAAYHHLFQEYDAHIKSSLEGDKRGQGAWQELAEARARLRAAEEALAAKQELIDRLKAEAERHRAALDTIPVLRAQADIYKADFEAERAAREQLHAQREELQEALAQLRLRLDSEGSARLRLEEMRNRHSELRPLGGAGFGGLGVPPPEEEPDLCCPKCQFKAPDMDTLQIHVMDCIK